MEENVMKSTWSGAPMISSESGSDTLKKFPIQYLLRLKLLKSIPGTTYLGYRFGSVSNQSEPARKTWLERWSTLKSGHKRKRHKRISGANYRRHLISLRRSWLQPGCSLLTENNTLFPLQLSTTLRWVQRLKLRLCLTKCKTKRTLISNKSSLWGSNLSPFLKLQIRSIPITFDLFFANIVFILLLYMWFDLKKIDGSILSQSFWKTTETHF